MWCSNQGRRLLLYCCFRSEVRRTFLSQVERLFGNRGPQTKGQDDGDGDFERTIAERVAPRFNDIEQRIRKSWRRSWRANQPLLTDRRRVTFGISNLPA